MLIQRVSFVLLFTYISASPFIVQTIYGLTPLNFSIMFAFIGVTLIISSQLTGKLVDYIDRLLLLRIMSTIQVIYNRITNFTQPLDFLDTFLWLCDFSGTSYRDCNVRIFDSNG